MRKEEEREERGKGGGEGREVPIETSENIIEAASIATIH